MKKLKINFLTNEWIEDFVILDWESYEEIRKKAKEFLEIRWYNLDDAWSEPIDD